MHAPAAVYVGGAPTHETERVAQRLLDLRPGALIVVGASVARTEPPATEPG